MSNGLLEALLGISFTLTIFISSNNFKLKNENNELVSFNGQSVTFRLSIKEV